MKSPQSLGFVALATCLLASCASPPPSYHTQRSIVVEQPITANNLNQELGQLLDTTPPGSTVTVNGNRYRVITRYISALGQDCITLGHSSGRSSACKDSQGWRVEAPLLKGDQSS